MGLEVTSDTTHTKEEGYYYPHEIEAHLNRQKEREGLDLCTFDLTVPKEMDHNYQGARVQWEAKGLEFAQEEGFHHVRQAENVVHRMNYRPGCANFDRCLILGPGVHEDRANGEKIPGTLHVTAQCDNQVLRDKNKACTIHQYIRDEERYILDPWISESSMPKEEQEKKKMRNKKKRVWGANRRLPHQYRDDSPIRPFDLSEFEGREKKEDTRVTPQQKSLTRIDLGHRSF